MIIALSRSAPPSWRGEEIKGDCTYQQYLSAKALFTDAALKASSETEALRRLAFPVYLASAIGDLSEIHQKAKSDEGMWVQDMPLIAGSPFVFGFCGCLQEALETKQYVWVKHLCQASISVLIRFKHQPTIEQTRLDSTMYSEVMRSVGKSNMDSFWDFAAKVAEMP